MLGTPKALCVVVDVLDHRIQLNFTRITTLSLSDDGPIPANKALHFFNTKHNLWIALPAQSFLHPAFYFYNLSARLPSLDYRAKIVISKFCGSFDDEVNSG